MRDVHGLALECLDREVRVQAITVAHDRGRSEASVKQRQRGLALDHDERVLVLVLGEAAGGGSGERRERDGYAFHGPSSRNCGATANRVETVGESRRL